MDASFQKPRNQSSIRQLAMHLSQQVYLANSIRGTCSSCVHWMRDIQLSATSQPKLAKLALAQQAKNITLYLRSGPQNNTFKNKSLSGQLTQSELHLLQLNYLKVPDELPSCLLSDSRGHFLSFRQLLSDFLQFQHIEK